MLNNLAKEIHNNATNKGWWIEKRSPLEVHALIHSEISEATEEVRNNKPQFYIKDGKPEGQAIELIDALIRILDYLSYIEVDIDALVRTKMDYNLIRPHRHGGKLY